MKIVSNLNDILHERLINYINSVNSIPCILNYFEEYEDEEIGELETLELINFKYENDTYFLVYEPKELNSTPKDKIEELNNKPAKALMSAFLYVLGGITTIFIGYALAKWGIK